MYTLKQQWFGNVRADVLSGIVVALALIPESIAFSILAGVDPMVGLYASFLIAVTISFVGGRTAMISASTGAMSILVIPLVRDYGLDYLLAATILTGLLQIIFGVLKVAKLMTFIPNAVMIGFVNSLSILIFIAQLPNLINVTNLTYVFVAVTLIILIFLPKFFKAIPAPLIAILLLSAYSIFTGADVKTVGDMGTITQSLPSFFIPNVPWNFETVQIILPFSISLAIVGLLESLLTAQILDDMTAVESNKNKEARGQGIANVVTGFFGGMAGCAMIGQSMINVKNGGRGRLSTFVAGAFLMFLIFALGDFVMQIPMAALVGVMIMVSIGSFDWKTFQFLRKAPRTDAIVLLSTVAVVLYTHDLSKGVITGVLLSTIFFVVKISKLKISQNGTNYLVEGQLFFASTERFVAYFKNASISENEITLDFTNSKIWDDSGVGAYIKVKDLLKENGIRVTVVGLDKASKQIVDQLEGIS